MRCCMFDFWYRKQVKMTHKHIQTKANMDKLCETMQKSMLLTNQKETTQPRRPIRALPAPWVLSTAGDLLRYLHGSYTLPDRNPSSYVLFLRYFPLCLVNLLISVLYTQIELSLLAIITRHAPYCWLAACVFWDMVRHCCQKCFSKIA